MRGREEKKVKARVGFIAKKPRDVVRDLQTADKLNMFASAQEAPGSRTDIFDITFASERQMNKFMGAFDVMLIDMLESKMQLGAIFVKTSNFIWALNSNDFGMLAPDRTKTGPRRVQEGSTRGACFWFRLGSFWVQQC